MQEHLEAILQMPRRERFQALYAILRGIAVSEDTGLIMRRHLESMMETVALFLELMGDG